ncbi:MAG: MBL fold metallo-hydrolase [Alphaproteobacteria bacterium]|nr:MBL fold metallo-hydrolase [Alphaproteobacteria bacterium]MDE1985032.1 MBL fold metallo-hydrolase [Alphaproteobacteria bacterium]MDE2265527.1 MBL fold metallo-hydrolase [Alphaproteobacteria bacterium]
MPIPFNRNFHAPYGDMLRLSPLVRRLLANNPGPFTFMGTGVYVVGTDEVAVIDPGPLLPLHLEALKWALAEVRVSHILITHTHADHSPAARAVKQWTGAPIYAFGPHPARSDDGVRVEEGGDRDFVPDVRVKDGETITGSGWTIDCLHTPGHISNHMCYALRQERALFTGDHVMGWSTTVVSPPDGDMRDYIASLKKLMARQDRILYPTHGGPVENPAPFLAAYLAHRLEREAQIVGCLQRGIKTIPDMVATLYADVDNRLHPAAARSVEAHLIKLEKDGRVAVDDKHILARYELR